MRGRSCSGCARRRRCEGALASSSIYTASAPHRAQARTRRRQGRSAATRRRAARWHAHRPPAAGGVGAWPQRLRWWWRARPAVPGELSLRAIESSTDRVKSSLRADESSSRADELSSGRRSGGRRRPQSSTMALGAELVVCPSFLEAETTMGIWRWMAAVATGFMPPRWGRGAPSGCCAGGKPELRPSRGVRCWLPPRGVQVEKANGASLSTRGRRA